MHLVLSAQNSGGMPIIIASHDAGAHWTSSAFPMNGDPVLYADPTQDTVLYGLSGFVYKSVDGATFAMDSQIPNPTSDPDEVIYDMQVGKDGTIYAGAASGAYLRHPNDTAWTAINGDLPQQDLRANAITILERSGQPTTIARVTSRGLARSTDGGAHWNYPFFGGRLSVVRENTDPDDAATFFATDDAGRLYRTQNAGTTFTQMATSHVIQQALEGFPLGGSDVLVLDSPAACLGICAGGGNGGTNSYFSTDGGVTLTSSTGLPADAGAEIVLGKRSDTAYLVYRGTTSPANTGHVFVTENGGASWSARAQLMLKAAGQALPYHLLADPNVANRLYLFRNTSANAGEMRISNDGGATFDAATLPSGLSPVDFTFIFPAIDPTGRIYIFGSGFGMNMTQNMAFVRGLDGSWTSHMGSFTLIGNVLADANQDQRSSDGGVTFRPFGEGPTTVEYNLFTNPILSGSFFAHRADPNTWVGLYISQVLVGQPFAR
jgi:hypothetical protein